MYEILLRAADPIGMLGVIIILIAYYYLSIGRWIADSMRYQVLNTLGALLILYSLCFYWNTASVVMEVAWIAISLVGIYRLIKPKKRVKN